jgi:nuclear pore complex protein Nup53
MQQQKFLTGFNNQSFSNPIFNSSMNQSSFNHHHHPQQQQQQAIFQSQSQNPANSSTANNNNNNSISGPPINSLFDNLRNDVSFHTPTKSFYHSQQHIIHQDTPQPQHNASGFNQSRILSPIPLSFSTANNNNNKQDFNTSYQNPLHQSTTAPATMFNQSAAYNQRDFWITVFGFPQEALTIVLAHFSGCGTILEKVSSAGNWVHLRYSSRAECDKSLLYNGKVIGNNLMIGVVRCEEELVTEKENYGDYPQASVSKIRSLTQAAYRSARSDTEVMRGGEEPRKTTGIVNKAMDLLFGW